MVEHVRLHLAEEHDQGGLEEVPDRDAQHRWKCEVEVFLAVGLLPVLQHEDEVARHRFDVLHALGQPPVVVVDRLPVKHDLEPAGFQSGDPVRLSGMQGQSAQVVLDHPHGGHRVIVRLHPQVVVRFPFDQLEPVLVGEVGRVLVVDAGLHPHDDFLLAESQHVEVV